MKKYLSIPAIIISVALTCLLIYAMNYNVMKPSTIFLASLAFLIINYILLFFLIKALVSFYRVFKLKDVKLNSYAYYLYPIALILSLVTFDLILFRMGKFYAPTYLMALLIALSILSLLICQLGGAFPDIRENDRKLALRHEAAGGAKGGFEILASLTGKYDDGIIIGTKIIDSKNLNSMHKSGDAIIIEGASEKKTEIILLSEKSQAFFQDLLGKRLNMPEKEVKTGLNLKKVKKDDYYIHNREQRRRQMKEKNKDKTN